MTAKNTMSSRILIIIMEKPPCFIDDLKCNALNCKSQAHSHFAAINFCVTLSVFRMLQLHIRRGTGLPVPDNLRILSIFTFSLAPYERSSVLLIDFSQFFYTVNIWLIDALNASSAAVVTAGAELAVDAARPPQSLIHDFNTFFSRRILYQ